MQLADTVEPTLRESGTFVEPTFSIRRLLAERVAAAPNSVALTAPGREPLTYWGLAQQIDQIVAGLTGIGVGRVDRVAIALGNGPEMATTFLATATAATAAPLNPNYTASEFDFYLSDIAARAVIVESGVDSPVRAVARNLGIAVLEIAPLRDLAAGRLEFRVGAMPAATAGGAVEADDVALILHTSGTTSRPKMIPLSQSNVCASARHIRSSLRLMPADRCLNVMPLFHIHGLIAGLLSPLAAGGSVVCTPGFSAIHFFQWLDESKPTWYTAVPAMHQEVLAVAEQNRDVIARCQLRFIRSSSAALAPQVMSDLERAFAAPVIEAYGMTEAAHQIASNPLPPGSRKAGSVGLPAGPEVSILDEAGRTVSQGETGEVAIRGPNVSSLGRTVAVDGSPERWFRTGDLGFFDRDGYLFISGRLKEIINRGGEKISPREIDEVLLQHPAVAQVVACAVPDPRLGEDVIAIVVERPGSAVSERELREFASTRLASFKVPRRMLFVDQIPKGPTGKIQRIGLANRLGIESLKFARPAADAANVVPQTHAETVIAQVFQEVLKLEHVAATDNFFELGGDSLASVLVVARIEEQLGVTIDVRQLALGTVQQVAAACDEAAVSAHVTDARENILMQTQGNKQSDHSLWRRFRRQTRLALVASTLPIATRLPIAKCPGWLGTLHAFRVPNNIPPRVWQGPGGGSNPRIILQLLDSVLALDGDVAECGVWKAETLIPLGLFLKQRGVQKTAYGFDSFEGLGDLVQVDLQLGGKDEHRKNPSGFSDTSYPDLVAKVSRYGLGSFVKLVKGYFQDTLKDYATQRFCFVHLDCVIYESYKQCLEFFYPRMVKGGIILLDEYRDPPWPGCTKAVDEFLSGVPERIEEMTGDNQVKFYFRKQ